jgi:hypothetical protein
MQAVGDAVPGNAAIAWQGPPPLTLVSCIMPTTNRRRFVPAAIGMFLAQDYPNKELVILDGAQVGTSHLMAALHSVWTKLERPLTAAEWEN